MVGASVADGSTPAAPPPTKLPGTPSPVLPLPGEETAPCPLPSCCDCCCLRPPRVSPRGGGVTSVLLLYRRSHMGSGRTPMSPRNALRIASWPFTWGVVWECQSVGVRGWLKLARVR